MQSDRAVALVSFERFFPMVAAARLPVTDEDPKDEVIAALIDLGYKRADATTACTVSAMSGDSFDQLFGTAHAWLVSHHGSPRRLSSAPRAHSQDLDSAPSAPDIKEIAMMRKTNGNSREYVTQIIATPTRHTRTEEFREISSVKMTAIVCTPARLVDVLEHMDGVFTLRETIFNFNGRGSCSVQSIPLQPHELDKLGTIIPRLLEQRGAEGQQKSPPEQEEPSRPRTQRRAAV